MFVKHTFMKLSLHMAVRLSVPKPLKIPHLKAKINLFSRIYICVENIFHRIILMKYFGAMWFMVFCMLKINRTGASDDYSG